MPEPLAPLWGFFQLIRDKGTVPLSIEQYFYLFHAMHRLDMERIRSTEGLRAFTKLFWLMDRSFEQQYDFYFDQLKLDQDLSENRDKKPNTSTSSRTEEDKRISNPEATEDEKKEADTPAESVQKSDETDAREYLDFELVLLDATTSAPAINEGNAPAAHAFVLSDAAILPFDARNFVQRLRRKVETAEQVSSEVIDTTAMIRSYTETGFIDEVVYEMEDASHSNVVLLSDRFGSMLAYEFLETHFASGLKQIPHCDFQHYAFYNLPQETVEGHYLMQHAHATRRDFDSARHNWNYKTWFFVLSDAGAHSGMVNRERMHGTLRLWKYLKQISPQIHWINPVPFRFLNDCTAKRLQMTIPMIDPESRALNAMIYRAKATR